MGISSWFAGEREELRGVDDPTYPVLPALSTAGNGTQPLETWRKGLYFRYKEPRVPLGTVWGKPTTALWLMRARRSRGAAREVEARAARARVRGHIVGSWLVDRAGEIQTSE
jgi:hypothetical protein